MSPAPPSRTTVPRADYAPLFAALGDETRLALIGRLSRGRPCSIAQLTSGTKLTRQAVTKHLRVLEGAGVVACMRSGRQSLYALDPTPLVDGRGIPRLCVGAVGPGVVATEATRGVVAAPTRAACTNPADYSTSASRMAAFALS